MYRHVLQFVDALLECFSTDDCIFERILYLRHEIRRIALAKSTNAFTAEDILNTFSNNAMRQVVADIVSRVSYEKMDKWVKYVLGAQKSPAYTEPSSSNASSSSYSSSSSLTSSSSTLSSASSSSSSSSISTYSASSKSN